MATTALTLDEIYALAHDAMTANGCNDENASALADIVTRAERDAQLDGTSLKLALKHGADRGFLHRINATRYALTTTLLDFADTTESLASEQNFTVANFKDELGIGRKLAVEILEFFDSINFTQRQGNERTIANPKAIHSRLKL